MGVILTRHTGSASGSAGGSGAYTLAEKLNMELEMEFKAAFLCYYKEFTYNVQKLLSNVGIWTTSGKTTKLFNKDFSYSVQKLLDTTTLTRISPSATLISTFAYNTQKNLISITRTGSECPASSSSSSSSLSSSSSSSSSSLSSSSSSSSSESSSSTSSSSQSEWVIGSMIKSVIFDFSENNWGGGVQPYDYFGIRSIEFFDGGILNSFSIGDVDIYSTSDLNSGYLPENAFDQTKSKTSTWTGTSWMCGADGGGVGIAAPQRLIIVFPTFIEFDEIVVNNNHNSGNTTAFGVKGTKIYVSTDEITSTVYNEVISNSALIFDGDISKHSDSDSEDPESLTLL